MVGRRPRWPTPRLGSSSADDLAQAESVGDGQDGVDEVTSGCRGEPLIRWALASSAVSRMASGSRSTATPSRSRIAAASVDRIGRSATADDDLREDAYRRARPGPAPRGRGSASTTSPGDWSPRRRTGRPPDSAVARASSRRRRDVSSVGQRPPHPRGMRPRWRGRRSRPTGSRPPRARRRPATPSACRSASSGALRSALR